jgi:hypothetical protein
VLEGLITVLSGFAVSRRLRCLALAGVLGAVLIIAAGATGSGSRHRLWATAPAVRHGLGVGIRIAIPRASRSERSHGVRPGGTVTEPNLQRVGHTQDADVTVLAVGERGIPRNFLGLSTEYWEVPDLDRHRALFDRVLSMLRVDGDGPMMLRIGGDSADDSSYARDPLAHPPRWSHYLLSAAFFRHAAGLVRHAHVRFTIDLNVAEDSPSAAVSWAGAAISGLPAGSVAALEIGNEPDLFSWWHHRFAGGDARLPLLMRENNLTAEGYARVFGAYARALHAAYPTIGIAGPALSEPSRHLAWQTAALAAADGAVTEVTGHRYPLSACVRRPGNPSHPTIARVLSDRASVGMARSLGPAIADARRDGLPYVLTEFNSVTCGGTPGVSNAFATALWAPDALFSFIRAGVRAAALHVRPDAINAPFTFRGASLRARPLLYGLALFQRTLGPDAKLMPTRVVSSAHPDLRVWAVRTDGALHLLLINKSSTPITARLRLPAHGLATVQWLTAPSAASTSGETLAGQHISPNGLWTGSPVIQQVRINPDGTVVERLGGHSASLLRASIDPSRTVQSALQDPNR